MGVFSETIDNTAIEQFQYRWSREFRTNSCFIVFFEEETYNQFIRNTTVFFYNIQDQYRWIWIVN